MAEIEIEHQPDEARLEELDIEAWPVWQHHVACFPWTYDCNETCYLLAGEVVVTPDDGAPLTLVAGDLVTFPAGLSCTWDIRQPVRKHYKLF